MEGSYFENNPYENNEKYEQNPYESANQAYRQAAEGRLKKKKNKIPGIILAATGMIVMAVGLAVTFMGNSTNVPETAEPVDIYDATGTDEYAYTYIQYMTEAVACYEAMESLQFYIVLDAEWNPTVICLHEAELEVFLPYIEWLYSDSSENGPEETLVTGYAQPFNEELKQFVLEGFAYDFGDGYVDMNTFSDFFGDYYLQIGQKNGTYQISNAGIVMLLLSVVLIAAGCGLLYEPVRSGEEAALYMGAPVIEKEGSVGLGILGAFLGALLGGLLWTVIGALGIVSGWAGVLIIFFANMGYKMFSHRDDRAGGVVSVIFGFLVVVPATFLAYVWTYYSFMNEDISGYTSLARAMAELPGYMSRFHLWGGFVKDLIMGYGFMLAAGLYVLFAGNGKKKSKKIEKKY